MRIIFYLIWLLGLWLLFKGEIIGFILTTIGALNMRERYSQVINR
jgi:hypothetical protein